MVVNEMLNNRFQVAYKSGFIIQKQEAMDIVFI